MKSIVVFVLVLEAAGVSHASPSPSPSPLPLARCDSLFSHPLNPINLSGSVAGTYQTTDANCSVASAFMALNRLSPNAFKSLAQLELEISKHSSRWFKATREGGPGVGLSELSTFLRQIPIGGSRLHVVVLEIGGPHGESESALVLENALASVAETQSVLIANVDQGILFGFKSEGHFVYVEPYSAESVRIWDPDPAILSDLPGLATKTRLLRAIAAPDGVTGKARGLLQLSLK